MPEPQWAPLPMEDDTLDLVKDINGKMRDWVSLIR